MEPNFCCIQIPVVLSLTPLWVPKCFGCWTTLFAFFGVNTLFCYVNGTNYSILSTTYFRSAPCLGRTQTDCSNKGCWLPKKGIPLPTYGLLSWSASWSLLWFCHCCLCTTGKLLPTFQETSLSHCGSASVITGVSMYAVNMIQRSFLHPVCSGCICIAKICHCVLLIPNKIMLDL